MTDPLPLQIASDGISRPQEQLLYCIEYPPVDMENPMLEFIYKKMEIDTLCIGFLPAHVAIIILYRTIAVFACIVHKCFHRFCNIYRMQR